MFRKRWCCQVLLAVLLGACAQPSTPPPPENQATFADGVVVANDLSAQQAQQVQLRNRQVVAPGSVLDLKVGEVFFGNLGDRFVMRRVTARTENSGVVTYQTVPVGLHEVFSEGVIRYEQVGLADFIQTGPAAQAADGLKIKVCDKEFTSKIKADFAAQQDNFHVRVNLTNFNLCPKFKIQFDAGKKEAEILVENRVQDISGFAGFRLSEAPAGQKEKTISDSKDIWDLAAHLLGVNGTTKKGKVTKVNIPLKVVPRLVTKSLYQRKGDRAGSYEVKVPFAISCVLESGLKIADSKPSFIAKQNCDRDQGEALTKKHGFEMDVSDDNIKFKVAVGVEYGLFIDEGVGAVDANVALAVEALINAGYGLQKQDFSLGLSGKIIGGLNLNVLNYDLFEEQFTYTLVDDEKPFMTSEMVEHQLGQFTVKLPKAGGQFFYKQLIPRSFKVNFDPQHVTASIKGALPEITETPGVLAGRFLADNKLTFTFTPTSILKKVVFPAGCTVTSPTTCEVSAREDLNYQVDVVDNLLRLRIVPYKFQLPDFLSTKTTLEVPRGQSIKVGLFHIEGLRSAIVPAEWKSSNPVFVSITPGDLENTVNVKGNAYSVTELLATTPTGQQARMGIQVVPPELTIDPQVSSIQMGEELPLRVWPIDPRERFTWTSSNPQVLTVSETGVIKGVAEGSATITVMNSTFTSEKASLNVTVIKVAEPTIVYKQDFETASDTNWSSMPISTTPTGNRSFLGEFSNDKVTLTLKNLPAHREITVEFDVYVIRSWDGCGSMFGPDTFKMYADGALSVVTTFSNIESTSDPSNATQAYPTIDSSVPLCQETHPMKTGSVEQGSLGYVFAGVGGFDTVYRITKTVSHTGPELKLDFLGENLQELADESWGLDNVRVTVK